MKGTLLKAFISIIVIVFVVIVVITEDNYAQRLRANDLITEEQKVADKKIKEMKQARQEAEEELKKELVTYSLQIENSDYNKFTNKVDGYSISVPRNMKVDMGLSNVRAVLENEELRLEIYRQEMEDTTGSTIDSYISYSNKFIDNNIDHRKEYQGKLFINGRKVSILQWSRKPLKHVENDKFYYASVEILMSKSEVITFLFKSSTPFLEKEYLDIIRSFEIQEKTEKPYVKKIKQTVNTSWDENTKEVYEKYFGENSKLQWGIFETKAPVDFIDLNEIEKNIDFQFPILLYYTGFIENTYRHPRLAIALENAEKEGRLLELTLQTVAQKPWKGNMVYDVLDGKYDTFLNNYAKDVVDSEYPVLFRLGNEMNGDWCVYSSHHTSKDTEIFKAFYQYIYQIFEEAGADNVIWVWNPNGKSFPDFKWNDELCYYPGDEYVDVIGMTSYNTGTYYEGETWMEFDHMYDALYEKYINLYEKPLMITEFSSSSVGGDKEAWVENMFEHIVKYDKVKVAVWWDGCDWDTKGNVARPYFIDETDELVEVFRENLSKFK